MDYLRKMAIRAIKKQGKTATKENVNSVLASMRLQGLEDTSPVSKIVAAADISVESHFSFKGLTFKSKAKPNNNKVVTSNKNDFSGVSCPRCGKPMVFANTKTRKCSYCLSGCRIALPFKAEKIV